MIEQRWSAYGILAYHYGRNGSRQDYRSGRSVGHPSRRHIEHAAIDLDALGLAHLGSASDNDKVMYRNLQSVCDNYASVGVRRLLLARAMEGQAELEFFHGVVSATNTLVCRLTASREATERRVGRREFGVSQREYVARAATLNSIVDRARLEDFTVTNENRSVTEVAHEMLVKARWIVA